MAQRQKHPEQQEPSGKSTEARRKRDAQSPPQIPPVRATPPPHVAEGAELENIPDEWLPEDEQVKEKIDRAGLNIALPGEDAAGAEAAEELTDYPGDEGELREEQ